MQAGSENLSEPLARLRFRHPAPERKRPRILPVFLPLAGCRDRCIFCAQEMQSGTEREPLGAVLARLTTELSSKAPGRSYEIAFYGGTFTSLPPEWMEKFLCVTRDFRDRGIVSGVRCSTRPDTVSSSLLEYLKGLGLTGVEFGVQSFDNSVLTTAWRGHSGKDSIDACHSAKQAGLSVTLQLLPGLPGHTPELFREDIRQCLDAGPDAVRLHPCLVLAGTGLESLWRSGSFAPWSLERTVDELGRAVLALWHGNIAVSRIGLAPEPLLEVAVLAGPRHPALGTMVRARALYGEIADRLAGRRASMLTAPQSASGEFWGHGGEMEPVYAAMGLTRDTVRFLDTDYFELDVKD